MKVTIHRHLQNYKVMWPQFKTDAKILKYFPSTEIEKTYRFGGTRVLVHVAQIQGLLPRENPSAGFSRCHQVWGPVTNLKSAAVDA